MPKSNEHPAPFTSASAAPKEGLRVEHHASPSAAAQPALDPRFHRTDLSFSCGREENQVRRNAVVRRRISTVL
jgi:hypothetical protein